MQTFKRASRALVIVLLLGCWALAAGPATSPISVKKVDGTTVSGEMISIDPENLVLLPPGKKDAIVVAWKDVASVSNGLTQRHAVSIWKAKNQDHLCGTCTGDRTVAHDDCQGKGIDPEKAQACAPCKGEGAVGKCTNVKCKEGKVDCPGDCLKRSVGNWVQRDGQWVREWKFGRDTFWVTTNHLGELFTAGPNGYEAKGDCPICQRTSQVDCGVCVGKGKLPCKPCKGVGVTGPACTTGCTSGRVACPDCKGKGVS